MSHQSPLFYYQIKCMMYLRCFHSEFNRNRFMCPSVRIYMFWLAVAVCFASSAQFNWITYRHFVNYYILTLTTVYCLLSKHWHKADCDSKHSCSSSLSSLSFSGPSLSSSLCWALITIGGQRLNQYQPQLSGFRLCWKNNRPSWRPWDCTWVGPSRLKGTVRTHTIVSDNIKMFVWTYI